MSHRSPEHAVNRFERCRIAAVSALFALMLASCSESSAPRFFESQSYPANLSDWRMMQTDEHRLVLDPALVAYDLATPLFSDYALKLRTVWLPEGSSASYTDESSLDFPVGTVISKTFYYPRDPDTSDINRLLRTESDSVGFDGQSLDLNLVRLIETRLLVRQTNGWEALPYVWHDDQSDATLQITGAIKRLQLRDADAADPNGGSDERFAYVVPNRNECASCHVLDQNAGGLSPIGPSVRNLNKIYHYYPNGAAQQLDTWQERGLLASLPAETDWPVSALWQAGALDDLNQRARSYLDVNCGHCHQPGGSGDTSGLFLHFAETDYRLMGLCKPPVAAGRGTGGRRFSIVPGQPEESILSYRISSKDVGVLMPEVGRSLVHEAGLKLINEWIRQMPGDCN